MSRNVNNLFKLAQKLHNKYANQQVRKKEKRIVGFVRDKIEEDLKKRGILDDAMNPKTYNRILSEAYNNKIIEIFNSGSSDYQEIALNNMFEEPDFDDYYPVDLSTGYAPEEDSGIRYQK